MTLKLSDHLRCAASLLATITAASLFGCEMLPAELLDNPRILAIRADPPGLPANGAPVTLEALTFAIDGDLRWYACPVAWAPTDPLSCPTGDATDLGVGNPLTTTLTLAPGAASLWIRAEGGDALPAVRLLKADPAIVNPVATGLADSAGQPLPASVAPETVLELVPVLGPENNLEATITSWYVTAGTLEPARTTGVATATLTFPTTAPTSPVTIVAVIRNTDGGTTWATATVEVTP